MLGDRVGSLNHSVGVEEVGHLAEPRDVHEILSGCSTGLEFANLGGEGSGAAGDISDEFLEMPLVVEAQKVAQLLSSSKSEHTGICSLKRCESGFQG